MALKDFLSLADDKLHEVFAKKAYDPQKDRERMVKRLDTANNQFQSATPTKGQKIWKIANGVVELTLPFFIGGKSVFHLPSERFSDAIKHLKEAVLAGDADEHLKAGAQSGSDKPARIKREPTSSGGDGGRSWSPERKAKFAATIAARNAAKGKG